MAKYYMSIDSGMGGRDSCEAETLNEAREIASDWARDGVWREDGTVRVRVWLGDAAAPDEDAEFDVDVKKDETIYG